MSSITDNEEDSSEDDQDDNSTDMKSDGMKLLVSGGDQSSSTIAPDSDEFTGFVFKLQANLDPRHRDRMAFIRVCSGTFRKGMKVGHSRMKKTINLSSAQRYHTSSQYTPLTPFQYCH